METLTIHYSASEMEPWTEEVEIYNISYDNILIKPKDSRIKTNEYGISYIPIDTDEWPKYPNGTRKNHYDIGKDNLHEMLIYVDEKDVNTLLLEHRLMLNVSKKQIENSNYSDLLKKYFKRYLHTDASGSQIIKCYTYNLEAFIEDFKNKDNIKKSTLKDAYFNTKYQSCNLFEDDLDGLGDIKNLTIDEIGTIDNIRKELWNIDTACRHQISYIFRLCFTFKELSELVEDELINI